MGAELVELWLGHHGSIIRAKADGVGGTMGNTDKVVGFLRKNKGRWYCDSCISKSTGVKPSN